MNMAKDMEFGFDLCNRYCQLLAPGMTRTWTGSLLFYWCPEGDLNPHGLAACDWLAPSGSLPLLSLTPGLPFLPLPAAAAGTG